VPLVKKTKKIRKKIKIKSIQCKKLSPIFKITLKTLKKEFQ